MQGHRALCGIGTKPLQLASHSSQQHWGCVPILVPCNPPCHQLCARPCKCELRTISSRARPWDVQKAHMMLKMQWEDAGSGFSFLFPARYSPVEDAICLSAPPQHPRGNGDRLSGAALTLLYVYPHQIPARVFPRAAETFQPTPPDCSLSAAPTPAVSLSSSSRTPKASRAHSPCPS